MYSAQLIGALILCSMYSDFPFLEVIPQLNKQRRRNVLFMNVSYGATFCVKKHQSIWTSLAQQGVKYLYIVYTCTLTVWLTLLSYCSSSACYKVRFSPCLQLYKVLSVKKMLSITGSSMSMWCAFRFAFLLESLANFIPVTWSSLIPST